MTSSTSVVSRGKPDARVCIIHRIAHAAGSHHAVRVQLQARLRTAEPVAPRDAYVPFLLRGDGGQSGGYCVQGGPWGRLM
jgi:hypothetical protein